VPSRPVVASGHPAVTAAALEVLDAGGNAFDAVVAAGFAGALAEPSLTSLAGGGFLLAAPHDGAPTLLDFFVDTPGRDLDPPDDPHAGMEAETVRFRGDDQVFHVGPGSLAVPGCLAGFLHVHDRLGRLALDRVVAPAVALARDGVVLGRGQATVVRLLEPIMTREPEGRERYGGRDGAPFGDDQRAVNAPLAEFLTDVGLGRRRGFADADLAPRIVSDLASRGGRLSLADLEAYRVIEREPLAAELGDVRILTNAPPSYGGELVVRAVSALLARPDELGQPGSAQRLARVADAIDEVTRWHRARERAGTDAEPPNPDADPSPGRPNARRGTTHVSVTDADGSVATMTTSNGSTSGVHLVDTGIMANNVMGEADLHPHGFGSLPPGLRVGSMMAPSLLEFHDGRVVALGSGGSERIRSALTQVIVAVVHDRLPLDEAVRAPRLHPGAGVLQLEPGHDADAVRQLAQSRSINVWDAPDLYFGGVNAVDTTGAHVADPRRGGTSAAG